MTVATPSKLHPRLQRTKNAVVGEWNRIGSQTQFYVTTLGSIPDALCNYRSEMLRLIAQMGLGTAALAMIGGTVVIVGFLTMTTGALVAVQGYNQLASVGIEALTGFASAYFNVRLIVPGTASVALSATIGAGATAQIGAMRINEEIDALEVIGIRSVTYLASTRVVAGVVVVIPLYCIAVMMAFLASRARHHRRSTARAPASTTTTSTRSSAPATSSGRSSSPLRSRSWSCWCTPTTATPRAADRPELVRPSDGRCAPRWWSPRWRS